MACQTIHKNQDVERNQQVLAAQKSLIIDFINKGAPQIAYKELRKILIKYPQDADFLNLMGLTQLALENADRAVNFFKKSYKSSPRTSVALNLSSAYIELNKNGSAIKVLKNILTNPPQGPYAHPERIYHNIALAYERIKKYSKSIRFYKKALSENPSYYLSLMRLGKIYELQKDYSEATKIFIKAKIACIKCFDPVNALALRYIATGQYTKANKVVRKFALRNDIRKDEKQRASKLMSMITKLSQSDSPTRSKMSNRKKRRVSTPL